MATSRAPVFWRGCSYYPPHHDPADWDRDFARMKAAGFNAIRTAELLASWDQIEREPRRPDFSWLDRAFDLAAAHGLSILLGTGACCPPIWMLDEYPNLQVISRDGVPYPTGAGWSWACINHPGYLAESDRYLGQLIERYAGRSALLGWQVHNEPGYPFIPKQGHLADWYDYNPHTVAKFREWLKAKYQTLDALNVAWRWDPTHHQYRDWGQIQAPRAMPIEWGIVTAWLDWRTFCTENWTAFLGRQAALIRERDRKHPTTTNLWSEATDFTGRLAIDPWQLAKHVDAIGYDLYPGLKKYGVPERRREPGGPAYVSWYLNFGWSTAVHAGKAFWLDETESGPLDGWIKGPKYVTTALDIKRWYLETIAHGATLMLYQGYREWNCIPIHWGALVDLHGEPTDRYRMAAKVNDVVRRHEALITAAKPARAAVGMFYSHENMLVSASMGADDFSRRSMLGLHEAIWAAHQPVEFVTAEYLPRAPYRVLFIPFGMVITAEAGRRLRRFVERGGTLVGFAKCAMLDDRGWYWNTRPGAGLDDVFGVREREIYYRQEPFTLTATLGGARLTVDGFHHQQWIDVAAGAQVLGTFADGTPAVTSHAFGEGRAIYIATHLDIAAFGSRGHHAFFRQLFAHIDLEPPVRVTGHGDAFVDPHLLIGPGGQRLLIVSNEHDADVGVTLWAPSVRAETVEETFGLPITVRQRDGLVISMRLPAQDAAMLRIGP
jgi:beta-galactosidase GanA